MGFLKCMLAAILVFYIALSVVNGDALVPSLCIFGDSVVDAGNNNNLQTIIKSNFPPYGRDFVTHRPTGRFCNGKLATDFTAEFLGFDSYPPAYLGNEARGNKILTGVNFASGASGYYDNTARMYGALTLTQQLSNYRDWQNKVTNMVGKTNASAIFSGGIHLLSAGSSDFLQNYYLNPILNNLMTPEQFSSQRLMTSYTSFVQNLYALGVRRIGVTNLPPIGCLPAAITVFGSGSRNKCVARLNLNAISFNNILNNTSQNLKIKYPDLKLVVFDIYNPLLEMILKPSDNGFFESRRACCGTGTIETSYLCNSNSVGTCSNATQYVFWDGFHPSEAANNQLAQSLLSQGIDLIS